MFLETLLPVALAFLVVTASPGPAVIAAALVTMQRGRRDGLLFGLGLSVGLGVWGVVAATGLGVLLESSAQALVALKIVGGLYLLWLAAQSMRSAARAASAPQAIAATRRWFWKGLMLNLSNPKAVFAWMAALSMGLGAQAGGTLVATATLMCMGIGLLTYTAYALAFSLPGLMAGYQRVRRWVDGVVAGLFAIAGFSLIRSAVSR
ncbi:LysE family translocator [Tateyamaria sp. SN3-11]|uniref:LysE family translocator n=1 Tax=Tateyamaria sp. SN3-11 TaxID=3092147 RepID=UPI0039EA5659